MPWRESTDFTARTLAIDTGWPPPVLLVTVIMAKGIRSVPCSAMQRSSAPTSMLPLNGASAAVS